MEAATAARISNAQKIGNMIGVALPVIAFVLAIVLLWHKAVGWLDLAVMAVLYVLTGLGITVGYHRLLTHRAFQTSKPIQYLFAILGSMSVQGPVLSWVADHRKHHAHTDEEGDPHSPHLAGHGVLGALKGLWHAHVGGRARAHLRAPPRDVLDQLGLPLLRPPRVRDRRRVAQRLLARAALVR